MEKMQAILSGFVILNFVIKHLYWEFLRKKFEAEFGVSGEADEVIDPHFRVDQ
ncbi:MAG: hypothetical protein IPN18_07130 [Ignavibacteriales bacterium]|nr:hypothetical protein [Ignavibacteriales bacterium]